MVGNIVKGTGLSYSRDDERTADNLGMRWAALAGYSSYGSYRFADKMKSLNNALEIPFLSAHPGNNERIKNAITYDLQYTSVVCNSLEIRPNYSGGN